ncbi:hypothetical protein SAMN05192558_105176 [Actinokineospora alba]|uniref:PH domain-containing protein n=1 Tax=Actinokineospora alba TaxID=504798 RepID=A0A1H0N397_9PSEU|nr:hypothetical protein C8E96_4114 [Actinokineospora alba]SDH81478.1 hypothetical protein SAMN05421871_102226 [Actinokineospora alba]SDO87204.1 hypothetical protein SAMN05192558_105176 [Actinokineospora alba]
MPQWRRVSPRSANDEMAGVFTLLGAGFTGVMIYIAVRDAIKGGSSLLALLGVIAFLASLTTFSYQMFKRGIYVSELGVRSQELTTSQTFPWESIHRFKVHRTDPIHFSEEVLIVLRDGSTVPTPVRYPDDPEITHENVVKHYWAGPTVCRIAVDRLTKELAQARSRADYDT